MKRLAIITTHPIQYNAPFFKLLAERKKIEIKVFYTWSQSKEGIKYDPGFGKNIEWDIPLLEGYDYTFVENHATNPGSHTYKGINNPTLIKEIVHWGAHIILVYGWNFKSHLHAIRFFKGKIPVLFRGDSTLLDEKKGLKRIIRRAVLKYIYSFVDIALYTGKANKNYFIAHGFKSHELIYMPHAIDNKRFKVSEIIKDSAKLLRRSLNIPESAHVFLFAGKLQHKKQPDFLAKVFSELNDENAYLIIAGSGIMENTLKDQYGNHPFIRFISFLNQLQMPALYACSDVFILPSKGPGETWGLSINEAMAAGKAIIVSDACGAAYDLVVNKKNGFVFEKNNENMLKKSLLYFIENKYAFEEMGENSLKMIMNYSFEIDCASIENLLLSNYK